ncbi:MAG: nucleotide sugar dehydrogenase [Candidatus Latescibacteria bacterium]|nr:nucleotide sugar dehydrogenase [bacterium]MBD3422931.1 nucleotide sugar dehydrogenase [Candidatus Latescibacterota bacterium]
MDLIEKIESGNAVQAVVGLGYVGLPLAVEFATAGIQTAGIDISENKIAQINKGKSYVRDVPDENLKKVVDNGKLKVSSDFSILKDADTVNIAVPTPLRKTKDPDISYIVAAMDEIRKYFHPQMVLILESTTYPGTTEEVILPMLSADGMKVGEDFYLAFSPERVDPGNKDYNTSNIPKVVGGVTGKCTELAASIYRRAGMNPVPVSSSRVAETVKLLENTFRSVNIGLVNEIALMCSRMGINVWEVIDAAKTKPFGFMPFYPGPGLGGHCIPIDPFYLSWKAKQSGFNSEFIELAGRVNGDMPSHVVTLVTDALNRARKCVNGSKILIMGVSYKKDIDDTRESPAFDIIQLLSMKGAQVCYHDDNIEDLDEGLNVERFDYSAEKLREVDCAIIVTGHGGVDYELLVRNCPLIFDSRNTLKNFESENIIRL